MRQALQVVANPTQFLGPRQLQQQQQQQVMPEEEEEQQLQSGAAAMQQVSPAAAAGLPDKEAVADEAPAAVDIVISDSETDDDLAPPPQLALQPQELQLPEPPSPLSQQEAQLLDTAALPQNLPFQQAHKHQQQQQPAPAAQLPPTAQRKGLLQISRSSAAGSLRKPPPVAPALPAAFPAEPIPVPEPSAFENEPMASPDGGRDPLQPSLSGSGDSSPAAGGAGNSVAAAAGAAEQQRPTSSSSAGPQVDEHFVTSRRPGASTDIRRQQQQQEQQAVSRRAVRDWSEDEVSGSSDDEFPTPKGELSRGVQLEVGGDCGGGRSCGSDALDQLCSSVGIKRDMPAPPRLALLQAPGARREASQGSLSWTHRPLSLPGPRPQPACGGEALVGR